MADKYEALRAFFASASFKGFLARMISPAAHLQDPTIPIGFRLYLLARHADPVRLATELLTYDSTFSLTIALCHRDGTNSISIPWNYVLVMLLPLVNTKYVQRNEPYVSACKAISLLSKYIAEISSFNRAQQNRNLSYASAWKLVFKALEGAMEELIWIVQEEVKQKKGLFGYSALQNLPPFAKDPSANIIKTTSEMIGMFSSISDLLLWVSVANAAYASIYGTLDVQRLLINCVASDNAALGKVLTLFVPTQVYSRQQKFITIDLLFHNLCVLFAGKPTGQDAEAWRAVLEELLVAICTSRAPNAAYELKKCVFLALNGIIGDMKVQNDYGIPSVKEFAVTMNEFIHPFFTSRMPTSKHRLRVECNWDYYGWQVLSTIAPAGGSVLAEIIRLFPSTMHRWFVSVGLNLLYEDRFTKYRDFNITEQVAATQLADCFHPYIFAAPDEAVEGSTQLQHVFKSRVFTSHGITNFFDLLKAPVVMDAINANPAAKSFLAQYLPGTVALAPVARDGSHSKPYLLLTHTSLMQLMPQERVLQVLVEEVERKPDVISLLSVLRAAPWAGELTVPLDMPILKVLPPSTQDAVMSYFLHDFNKTTPFITTVDKKQCFSVVAWAWVSGLAQLDLASQLVGQHIDDLKKEAGNAIDSISEHHNVLKFSFLFDRILLSSGKERHLDSKAEACAKPFTITNASFAQLQDNLRLLMSYVQKTTEWESMELKALYPYNQKLSVVEGSVKLCVWLATSRSEISAKNDDEAGKALLTKAYESILQFISQIDSVTQSLKETETLKVADELVSAHEDLQKELISKLNPQGVKDVTLLLLKPILEGLPPSSVFQGLLLDHLAKGTPMKEALCDAILSLDEFIARPTPLNDNKYITQIAVEEELAMLNELQKDRGSAACGSSVEIELKAFHSREVRLLKEMFTITVRFVHHQTHTPVLELEKVATSSTVGSLRELLMDRLEHEEFCMMRVFVNWHAEIEVGGRRRLIELTDEDCEASLQSIGISHLSEVHLDGPLTGDCSEGVGQALAVLGAQMHRRRIQARRTAQSYQQSLLGLTALLTSVEYVVHQALFAEEQQAYDKLMAMHHVPQIFRSHSSATPLGPLPFHELARYRIFPLHAAAKAGNVETIKMFADKESKENLVRILATKNEDGYSVLQVAVQSLQPDAIVVLIKLGADLSEVDERNRSLTQMAISQPPNELVVCFSKRLSYMQPPGTKSNARADNVNTPSVNNEHILLSIHYDKDSSKRVWGGTLGNWWSGRNSGTSIIKMKSSNITVNIEIETTSKPTYAVTIDAAENIGTLRKMVRDKLGEDKVHYHWFLIGGAVERDVTQEDYNTSLEDVDIVDKVKIILRPSQGKENVIHHALRCSDNTEHVAAESRFIVDGNYVERPDAEGEDIVIALLRSGADVTRRDYEGNTPLHIAAKHMRSTICKRLLGDELYDSNNRNQTPFDVLLSSVSKQDQAKILQVISILGGATPTFDDKDEDGNTPLHTAAIEGHAKVVVYLSHHSPRLDTKNKKGFSPIQVAIEADNLNCVKVLVAAGASLSKAVYSSANKPIDGTDIETYFNQLNSGKPSATFGIYVVHGKSIEYLPTASTTTLLSLKKLILSKYIKQRSNQTVEWRMTRQNTNLVADDNMQLKTISSMKDGSAIIVVLNHLK